MMIIEVVWRILQDSTYTADAVKFTIVVLSIFAE